MSGQRNPERRPLSTYRKHFLTLLEELETIARRESERAAETDVDGSDQWTAGYRHGESNRAHLSVIHCRHYLKLAERGIE